MRVNGSMSVNRGIALRKTYIRSGTLVKVKSALLSRTMMNRKTVITTNTLMLTGAIVRPRAL